MLRVFVITIVALVCPLAFAQTAADRAADALISQDLAEAPETEYFSQSWLIDTMEKRFGGGLDEIPRVTYEYYIIPEGLSRLEARLTLYSEFGDRDTVKPLLWILNRNDLENLYPGDTLIVPSEFGLDFRAYSPFPRYYAGAADVHKIVILDKSIQSWAGYEDGVLQRWGPISTGVISSRTPSGRFNVNWKQEERVSTLSPGVLNPETSDELWTMYWVMNIHETRGIHLHQYALPTSGPASHGCVRMLEPDAKWLYTWTDTWDVENQSMHISSAGGTITDQGTMVLIIGQDISGKPRPFFKRRDYPVLRMVQLPPDPYQVPPGSPQQDLFDRQSS